ncbi:hypothetical protein CFSAN002369_12555 [Clostridium botulinum CFSAN002369]|nr:hypothetical protein CFSAN002369_12555 [Clostridium botulinum CFSAN002369]
MDSAFISGVTPNLTIENILSGKVLLSGPAAKKLIITSSKDSVKASSAPDIIPGDITGSVTFVKVCQGVAPKS